MDRGLHSTAAGELFEQSQPQTTKASSYSLRQLVLLCDLQWVVYRRCLRKGKTMI